MLTYTTESDAAALRTGYGLQHIRQRERLGMVALEAQSGPMGDSMVSTLSLRNRTERTVILVVAWVACCLLLLFAALMAAAR
jgi:hypothetical protein